MKRFLKYLCALMIVIVFIGAVFHERVLESIGGYLVVNHSTNKADLIVCLAGGNVERGLASADLYKRGVAPYIYIAREELPDSYRLLKKMGIYYPESKDLFLMLMRQLGVPESSIIIGTHPVKSTYEEANLIKRIAEKRGFSSILIVTSPFHTRRAWWTFKRVFKGDRIKLYIMPSPYSEFKKDSWWKRRRYIRKVIIEYQKLIFYVLAYLL